MAIWYLVSNDKRPSPKVSDRPRKPANVFGEFAMTLNEFGTAPYLASTAFNRPPASPFAVIGSSALNLCLSCIFIFSSDLYCVATNTKYRQERSRSQEHSLSHATKQLYSKLRWD